jgi:hypothetical protein
MQTTLQTRAYLSASATQAFDACGALYGRLERSMFAAYCANGYDTKVVDKLKPKFCEEFCITARQFNSCWALLQGKIASRMEGDQLALSDVKAKLKGTRASVTKLLKQKKAHTPLQCRSLDGKRRRLAFLEAKFKRLLQSGTGCESSQPWKLPRQRKLSRALPEVYWCREVRTLTANRQQHRSAGVIYRYQNSSV